MGLRFSFVGNNLKNEFNMKKQLFLLVITIIGFIQFMDAQILLTSGTNPGCIGDVVTMTRGGLYSDWRVNGVIVASGTSFSYTIQSTSVYISVTSAQGGTVYADINLFSMTPPALTAISNSPICIGSTINLSSSLKSSPSSTYLWTGPNGFQSTLQNPIVSTSATSIMSGNYSVVEITAPVNCTTCNVPRSRTCQSSPSNVTVDVSLQNAPSSSNNGPVCSGNTLLLSASTIPGATYSWTGPNGFTSTQQNPTVSTNATTAMSGTYTVIATTTATGCSSYPGTTSVVINQASAGSNSPICSNGSLSLTASTIPGASYFWTGPNGFSSTEQNPIINTNTTSAMAGVYSVYTTVNGCTSPTPGSTTVIINPLPSTPIMSNNGPVCVGNQLSLTASTLSGATYSWAGPDGFTSAQQNPIVSSTATTAMSGLYNLIATVNGCSSIIGSTNVEINKITSSNNGPVCSGTTLSLNATSITGALYSWTGPNGFTSTQQNPIVSNNSNSTMTGVYSVTSTVNGCTSPNSVTLVSVTSSPSTPIITQVGNQLQSSATTSNQWYNQNGIIVGATSQIYSPTTSGNYYVITSGSVCSSTSATFNYTYLSNDNFNLENNIKIYPNPTYSKISIDCGSQTNLLGSQIKITNTLGQIIFQSILDQQIKEINLTAITGQGLYFINILDEQGHAIDVRKIILQ